VRAACLKKEKKTAGLKTRQSALAHQPAALRFQKSKQPGGSRRRFAAAVQYVAMIPQLHPQKPARRQTELEKKLKKKAAIRSTSLTVRPAPRNTTPKKKKKKKNHRRRCGAWGRAPFTPSPLVELLPGPDRRIRRRRGALFGRSLNLLYLLYKLYLTSILPTATQRYGRPAAPPSLCAAVLQQKQTKRDRSWSPHSSRRRQFDAWSGLLDPTVSALKPENAMMAPRGKSPPHPPIPPAAVIMHSTTKHTPV